MPGVNGYLVKAVSSQDLVEAVRGVMEGRTVLDPAVMSKVVDIATGGSPTELTGRELEVLELLARGLSNQEIGDNLKLSQRTIEKHVGRLLTKLCAHSRTEAVSNAIRRGMVVLNG